MIKMIVGFWIGCLLVIGVNVSNAVAHSEFQTNEFVQMVERHIGLSPGQTRFSPECSCTVKYLGTKIEGDLYDVVIEKLD